MVDPLLLGLGGLILTLKVVGITTMVVLRRRGNKQQAADIELEGLKAKDLASQNDDDFFDVDLDDHTSSVGSIAKAEPKPLKSLKGRSYGWNRWAPFGQ